MVELIVGVPEGQDELGPARITSYANHCAIDGSVALDLHPIPGPARRVRSIGTLGHNTFQLWQV
jgi:hypothetical protein